MGLPVSVVKIHHEGAGVPNDNAKAPYSVWIGPSGPQLTHSPLEDWSTLNLNHVVLGLCFSGQRQDGIPNDPAHPVTDQELLYVSQALVKCRSLGWVIATPVVSPHDNLSGSATLCPGSQVYARWQDVVNAVEGATPPPKQEDNVLLFPSMQVPPDPNKFFGVVVDLDKKGMLASNGVKVKEPLSINNPNPWVGGYEIPGGFVICTSDSDLYHFHWEM